MPENEGAHWIGSSARRAPGAPPTSSRRSSPPPTRGRVDALFVGDAPHPFGTFQPDLGRMEVHPASEAGDEDLVDAVIFHTLRTGGHVFAMEDTSLPLGGGLAALLRY
jgi:hypothetical protein